MESFSSAKARKEKVANIQSMGKTFFEEYVVEEVGLNEGLAAE